MRYYRIRRAGEVVYATAPADAAGDDDEPSTLELHRGSPWEGLEPTGDSVALADVELLAPCAPRFIVGVARNFAAHAEERRKEVPREPLIFMKPPSTVIPTGVAVVRPAACRHLNYEGELAVVIGRAARRVSVAEALDHVLGYACVNDVTARDIQDGENAFTRGKGYETFAPLGPCIATGLDPATLVIETYLNGELSQSGAVADLVHPVPELVAFISRVMPLEPGDVIATGTPKGMRPVEPGDTVDVRIAGIGRISNQVVAETATPAGSR